MLEALLADQQWQRWERGAASGGGTVWRHGCRHRASRDGFTACPDTGCGAAPPTTSAHRSICAEHLSFTRECFGLLRALARVPAWDTPQVRPCRLWRGIHAAQDPTPAPAQAPPVAVVTERNAGACWAAGGPNRTVTTGLLTCVGLESGRTRSDMPRSLTASTARAAAP
ncbi:hypothetical protein FHY22_002046 [Xanthomonas arboricola]|nr:hypothetical protein [Xanthomonas arboricola]